MATVSLAFTGDVMLGRLVNAALVAAPPEYVWGNTLPTLHSANLLFANLECALTAHTIPWRDGERKVFYFRADPGAVAALRVAGVDFVSLANNHAYDFGAEGLLETIAVLDRAGIAHAGAGPDLASARAPARLQANGIRVALVAFADHPRAWAAGTSRPGIQYTPVSLEEQAFANVRDALATARADADLVVFCIHWGPNMRSRPTPQFREFGHAVIDAGADIFWGHSAHVVQGVEVYKGHLILYDSGDFVDDYAVDVALRNDRSAIHLVHASTRGVERVELVPVEIRDSQVNLAREEARAWFTQRFTELSAEFGTMVKREDDRLVIEIDARQRETAECCGR